MVRNVEMYKLKYEQVELQRENSELREALSDLNISFTAKIRGSLQGLLHVVCHVSVTWGETWLVTVCNSLVTAMD